MAKKKKPPPPEEHGESAPLWIVSFCDLVMVMLGFFVIMAAGNPPDIRFDPEYADIVAAVKQAFKYKPRSDSTDPIDLRILMGAINKKKGRHKDGAGKRGEALRHIDGLVGKYDLVTTVRPGTQQTIGGVIRFQKDSAEITPEVKPILQNIASKIRGHTNVFLVKGHTSRDEEYRLGRSGVKLAYQRAQAVVSRLVALGVDEKSLRIVVCDDKEPLREDAYEEADHQVNRRVEVVSTEALVSDYHGAKDDKKEQTSANILDVEQNGPARPAAPPGSH